MVEEAGDQLKPSIKPERPPLSVRSENDLLGIAQSLGLSLEIQNFPYENPQLTPELLDQIRRDNNAEEMSAIALKLRQQYTPDYLREDDGELQDRHFGHPNEVGAILRAYKNGEISEVDTLAYLAECSLIDCVRGLIRRQQLEERYRKEDWAWVKEEIEKFGELIDFHYTHYRIYLRLIQRLRKQPELRGKIKPGLIDMETRILYLR